MLENPWVIGFITGIISAIIGGLIFHRVSQRRRPKPFRSPTLQNTYAAPVVDTTPVGHKRRISGFLVSFIILISWFILSPAVLRSYMLEINISVILTVTLTQSAISPSRTTRGVILYVFFLYCFNLLTMIIAHKYDYYDYSDKFNLLAITFIFLTPTNMILAGIISSLARKRRA